MSSILYRNNGTRISRVLSRLNTSVKLATNARIIGNQGLSRHIPVRSKTRWVAYNKGSLKVTVKPLKVTVKLNAIDRRDKRHRKAIEYEVFDKSFALIEKYSKESTNGLSKRFQRDYRRRKARMNWHKVWGRELNDGKGTNIAETATSAYLIGPWVKNSPTLGPHGLAEYSVTVKEEKIFNSFTIRPKICTDLSQCFDVNTIKITPDIKQTSRYGPTVHILDCSKSGIYTDPADPTKDLPNVCRCLPAHYGPKCEMLDYCADKQPGKQYCKSLGDLDCIEDHAENFA
ncbi:unnamed protein product, partial [Oppiella nova]